MKSFYYFLFLLVLTILVVSCKKETSMQEQTGKKVLPTPQQVKWANAKIGVIIHLDIDIYTPNTYVQGDSSTLPPLGVFRPSRLNTDQWIKTAKSAGAKYAIFVAKHGTGFANWPSKANDYNVDHTPWRNGKADIVSDFVQSCKKYGIKPGVYYSVVHSTLYEAAKLKTDSARKAYYNIVLEQEKELWTNYGKWFEIWFDGGVPSVLSSQLSDMIEKYQPQAILFQGPPSSKNLIRWVGNERGDAPYPMWSRVDSAALSNGKKGAGLTEDLHGDLNGSVWDPAEADFPIYKHSAWMGGWFWHANQKQDLISLHTMVKRYYTTVGRNTNMLIGMTVDTSGLIPEKQAHLFAKFGKVIKQRFDHSIVHIKGQGKEFVLKLGKQPKKVNQIVIMEKIAKGERIRDYVVQAWLNHQWKTIGKGQSVGHERIQTFHTIKTKKIRLKVKKAARTPIVKKFAAYYVNDLHYYTTLQ